MADPSSASRNTENVDKKFGGFVDGITRNVEEEYVKCSETNEECLPASKTVNEVNLREYPNARDGQIHQDPTSECQTNLFSYDDTEYYPNYHFGLIRGYHREMYEEKPTKEWFLCCSLDRETVSRIKRKNRALSCQVMGILFGAVFVFFGVSSLIVSFVVSSDETKDYFWRSLDIPSLYIHIIAIVGLTILSLGSALISLCLLVPALLGRVHGLDDRGFWCAPGDLYIKNAEKTYNLAPNQFLYFDAAVYGDFIGNSNVTKVQPELINEKN